MMHGREKSDSAIVAGKPTNKAVSTAAEPVERRAEAKGNASQQSTRRTQSRVSVSHALERIRQTGTKNALPSHTPKVGAVCPNWARTDLCGGRSVMSVPTAIGAQLAMQVDRVTQILFRLSFPRRSWLTWETHPRLRGIARP